MTEYITPIVSGLPIVTCPDGAEGPIMGRDIPEGWEACSVGHADWYPADRCNPALPYWTRPPQRDPWVGERVRVSREGFPVEGIIVAEGECGWYWLHEDDGNYYTVQPDDEVRIIVDYNKEKVDE